MADSISDLRRRTQEAIEKSEREHQAQIRELKLTYSRQMEDLRAESERQQTECRRRLAELDRQISEALAAGKRDVAEQIRKLKAEQQRKLNEIEANAAAALKKCSEELRAEIDRRYRVVEERIRQLYETIASQDEKERLCAERALRKAEDALRQVLDSEAVREFNKQILPYLQEMHGRLDGLCKQEIWSALGSSALALELSCVSAAIEAEEKLEAWTMRNNRLLQRIQTLQELLRSTRAEAWQFRHWRLNYTCALHPWNDAAFAGIDQHLTSMRAILDERSPRCPMIRMADMILEVSQEETLLDAAMDCAQQHVGSFLRIAQLLAGLTEELPLANPSWVVTEAPQMEPVANVGTMAFRRNDVSIGHLQITVQEQRLLGGGLMLTMRYDGTRSQLQRQHELDLICTRLAQALSDDQYGGVVLGAPALFMDDNVVCMNISVGDLHVQPGVWTGAKPLPHTDPAPGARSNPGNTAGTSSAT